MLVQSAKRLRLRAKTPPAPQQPLVGPLPDFSQEEVTGARQDVYLVTFPHPVQTHAANGVRLVAPESKTKEQVLGCLLDACAHPVTHGGSPLRALAH